MQWNQNLDGDRLISHDLIRQTLDKNASNTEIIKHEKKV